MRNRYGSGGCTCRDVTTCTPTGCFTTKACVTLLLSLHSTEVVLLDKVALDFRVVEGLPDDCIIGLEDISKLDLTTVFKHLFKKDSVDLDLCYSSITPAHNEPAATHMSRGSPKVVNSLNREVDHSHGRIPSMGLLPNAEAAGDDRPLKVSTPKVPVRSVFFTTGGSHLGEPSNAILRQTTPGSLPEVRQSSSHTTIAYLCSLLETSYISKDTLLNIEDDDDQIDDYIDPSPYEEWINTDPSLASVESDPLSKVRIFLPEELVEERKRLTKLLLKYRSLFSKDLSTVPARIDPFVLTETKDSDWSTSNRHKQSVRIQSPAKQAAIKIFVEKALALKVISPSQASSWSQVHLTKKHDGSWRFTLDFRGLNSVTRSMGWPIPNIPETLQRIGARRSKWFAIIDLTSGYNQIPMSEDSNDLTSFVCSEGLFKWNRLAMGLKGAGSYFQHHMSFTVLKGLVGTICHVYFDDIIVNAKTVMELIDNLEKVFYKARQFNIFFNPDKVKLCLTEVEYCGHLIDERGLSFSAEKKESVLNFARPVTHSQMKSFLGLCSQFREHVPNFGTLSEPLHGMIPNYKKNSKILLDWTDELNERFLIFQRAVSGCQKLFFLDDTSPIFLHTDASGYGIGGYLFQMILVLGILTRYPIMFVSRQLTAVERRWSTIEKEAFAIFYCFMKCEHLLRDRSFILKTDARNLTFLNTDHREKVKRWKISIQSFDFKVEHIRGVDNIEADAFSRLVPFPEEIIASLNSMRQRIAPVDTKSDSLPADIYQKILAVHNGVLGHGGVQRTLDLLLRKKETWKGMRKHVAHFVRRCPCCQKMSQLKPVIHTKPFVLAAYEPMDRICIDAIGPINEEGQDDLHNYILVIIDAFSRFVRLYPVKDTTANSALTPLLDWICTFGCPSAIVSDNGTQFVNNLVKLFFDASQIEHALINAYNSEENGLVERANKEVNRHVRSMSYDTLLKAKWVQNCPFIQRILNTMVHSSIGVSPSQLIFGDAINHDSHFLTKPSLAEGETTYRTKVAELYENQARLLNVARQTQLDLDSFHLAQRDTGKMTSFAVNSYVLAQYETSPPSKFSTKLHGPYRVINVIGPIYTLQNLVTNKCVDFHVKLLREFLFDPEHVDPMEVQEIS